MSQHILRINTPGRGFINITSEINSLLEDKLGEGMCFIFSQHTSASLIISENSDPSVLDDLEYSLSKLVRDGDPNFKHTLEGPDDMAAHARSILTASSLAVPYLRGQLALGTWQAIYFWEHRLMPQSRKIICTIN